MLVVKLKLFILFTNLAPINIAAVHWRLCLVLNGSEIEVHADCANIAIESIESRAANVNALVQ